MTTRAILLLVPFLLAGCSSQPADTGSEMPTDPEVSEETRLADDVQEGEEWTDTPMEGDAATPEGLTLTMADVEMNDSEQSCWSVIDGQVYDLTDWISKHPGGASRIIQLCGTDGTGLFQGQHGGSAAPESTLESYLIGPLQ